MATQGTQPRIFIGSSSGGIEVAKSLKSALQEHFESIVWNEDVFPLSKFTLESLVKAGEDFNFAVLALTRDDMVTKQETTLPAPRDNVIFEIGFFMGHIGPQRTFVVYCEDDGLALPSYLDGFTRAKYKRHPSKSMRAAMNPVALKIKAAITNEIREGITRVHAPESAGSFGEAVFNWMDDLSEGARKKLGQSEFINIGGTRTALMRLIASAKAGYSLLAICGYKGDYSTIYYGENFARCKAVRRVFSYEAIRNEIRTKKKWFALDGLKMHLDKNATGKCDVKVALIPKGKRIKHLSGGNFDPPFSFGLAILLDGKEYPKKAIIHWEMDAERLKHMIAIEGVIIDYRQKELLQKLVELHESIATSDEVLKRRDAIKRDYRALKSWKSQYLARKRGKR